MFSYLFGTKEAKEEEKVVPEPDWEISDCDECDDIPNEPTIDRMTRLMKAIPK